MLYFAIFFSTSILATAHLAAYKMRPGEDRFKRFVEFVTVGFSLAILNWLIFLSLVNFVLATFLCLALVLWVGVRRRLRVFFPLSLTAAAATYALFVPAAQRHAAEAVALRERFPFESMENRLPGNVRDWAPVQLTKYSEPELKEVENSLSLVGGFRRELALRLLHESKVHSFVNSPGFGVMRGMPARLPDLTPGTQRPTTPVQPATRGSESAGASARDEPSLKGLHRSGLLDFLLPDTFGYVRDRQRVAGFEAHRFSAVPESDAWHVERLELVSLLLHPKPAVYVSEKLPEMTDARKIPTRPLTTFEANSLDALLRGEDLVIDGSTGKSLMLGSLRNADVCQKCHGGLRGDLLGAFSYVLRRSAK